MKKMIKELSRLIDYAHEIEMTTGYKAQIMDIEEGGRAEK